MKKILLFMAAIAGAFTATAQCHNQSSQCESKACSPIINTVQFSGKVATNLDAPKEIGEEVLWKRNIGKNLYFNTGANVDFDLTNAGKRGRQRDLFEAGIPIQLEWGRLSHKKAGLYGIVGVMPTVYTTISSSSWNNTLGERVNDPKDTGFMIEPQLEFGGNIPVGNIILRVGVYGVYKLNCTPGDYNVYQTAGKAFFGAKIGVVL